MERIIDDFYLGSGKGCACFIHPSVKGKTARFINLSDLVAHECFRYSSHVNECKLPCFPVPFLLRRYAACRYVHIHRFVILLDTFVRLLLVLLFKIVFPELVQFLNTVNMCHTDFCYEPVYHLMKFFNLAFGLAIPRFRVQKPYSKLSAALKEAVSDVLFSIIKVATVKTSVL